METSRGPGRKSRVPVLWVQTPDGLRSSLWVRTVLSSFPHFLLKRKGGTGTESLRIPTGRLNRYDVNWHMAEGSGFSSGSLLSTTPVVALRRGTKRRVFGRHRGVQGVLLRSQESYRSPGGRPRIGTNSVLDSTPFEYPGRVLLQKLTYFILHILKI